MRFPHALIVLALAHGAALAGVNAKLVGEWSGQVTLRVEANGRCRLDQEAGLCQTLRGALLYQGPGGTLSTYGWKVNGDELTITGGNLAQPLLLRRVKPGAAPAPPPPATASAPSGPGRFAHPYWGVDFPIPANWKAAERDGTVLLGSDTEAGLILVRFMPSTTREMLLNGYAEGLREDGVVLAPATRAEEFAAGAAKGVAGELAGMAQNGSRLRARAVGVMTPFGDAAVCIGITSAEKYEEMKPKVDALAAAMTFTPPKIPQANVTVAGQYYYIFTSNSGSLYSREDSLSLCSNGLFARKAEMSGSRAGQFGAATQSGYAGRWSADGDGQNGTITLSYRDGRTERLRYQKAGADIVLNGKKYGRFGDGSCAR